MPRKTILIYHGDDDERLYELRTAVAVAERNATSEPKRFGDNAASVVKAAQDAYDAFVDEAAERAEEWVLESIGHEAWRDLLRAHPPRMVPKPGAEGQTVTHSDDEGLEVNTESFPKALLLFVDQEDDEHRTITKAGDHELSKVAARIRRLSQGQFEHLWVTAYHLNTGGIGDPKLGRFSPGDPRSDGT